MSAPHETLALGRVKEPILVFLDADDRLLPNALEAGITCLDNHPECVLASAISDLSRPTDQFFQTQNNLLSREITISRYYNTIIYGRPAQ